MSNTLKSCLDKVKSLSPLTLSITNQVTINDCANGILAVGASPVMSDDPADAETLGAMAAATVINIGTTNAAKLEVMLGAGRGARKSKRPLVLDPVGVGATEIRRATGLKIIEDLSPDIIRGNLSEIKALAGLTTAQKGVDSVDDDAPEAVANLASALAERLKTIVAVTGATDVISNGRETCFISGGHHLMTRLTGTGCTLSAIVGAYAGANPEALFQAASAALTHMALAGQKAAENLAPAGGLGTFKVRLFDYLAVISGEDLSTFAEASHG